MEILNTIAEKICGLPLDQQAQILKLTIADLYRHSLFKTCKHLLNYKDITEFTHGGIIEALESESRRKLICVPRGSFKSSIGVVGYSIWSLLRNPNLRILIDSEKYDNSKNFLREIKAHLVSEKLVNLFGEFTTEQTWNEGEIIIKQRTRNFKEASITCSGIGSEKTGQHYDLIIGDDFNSPKNSYTVELRQKVIDHHRMNTSILEPDGTLVIIGTRYASDDLIGWVLNNEIGEEWQT